MCVSTQAAASRVQASHTQYVTGHPRAASKNVRHATSHSLTARVVAGSVLWLGCLARTCSAAASGSGAFTFRPRHGLVLFRGAAGRAFSQRSQGPPRVTSQKHLILFGTSIIAPATPPAIVTCRLIHSSHSRPRLARAEKNGPAPPEKHERFAFAMAYSSHFGSAL